MSVSSVTAFEHQRLAIRETAARDAITLSEAKRLLSVGEARPGFCDRGYDHVKLTQYCGLISMGERVLEILPKTEEAASDDQCRGMLIGLLRHAAEVPIHRDEPVGQAVVRAPLLEVFVAALLEAIADVVRGGLLVQYRETQEDLPVVRGAIHFATQLTKNASRVDRIACRYDDLTFDNLWNQLLRFGLWSVRPLIQSSILYGRWVELASVFDGVSERKFTFAAVHRLAITRREVRYRAAVGWIRLFMQLLSPDLRSGAAVAPGLLFDMNLLFQAAVAGVMAKRIPRSDSLTVQEPGTALTTLAGHPERPINSVRPDLVVRQHRAVVAVGDTKWKRLTVGRSGSLVPGEEDVYQALAYAAAYRCQNIALIYPWHSGLVGSVETTLEIPGLSELKPVLSIICLDLRSPSPTAIRGGQAPVWSSLIAEGCAA